MSYATLSDLIARYGETELIQLTDREGLGEVAAEIVAGALADADAVIDGHLAGRYSLPISPVPVILVGYACDLARERLYKDAAPELIVKRGNDARRFLERVAAGQITLGVQPGPVEINTVQFVAGQKVFAREDL